MRYFPMILAAGLSERRITCGFRPGPRHAHARVGSFRCRGHAGRRRLPTTTDTPGDIIAVAITAMAITMATTGPTMGTATAGHYGYNYGYGRRWRY